MTESTPARPTIDFSGSSRATAREYARRHLSKVNKAETNAVLTKVANGEQVDAYDLNEAVLDAMRGATTRAGQSPLRRTHAREIAYLGHICQAVLENHADGLPVYAEGDRSRLVETLRGEVAALQAAGRDALDQVEPLVAKVQDLESRVGSLIVEKTDVELKLSDVERIAAERDALLAETVIERDALLATIEYAAKFLDAGVYAEVVGYAEGQKDARKA